MNRIVTIYTISFLILGLTGCVSIPKNAIYIDSKTKDNIRASDATLLKVQKELNTDNYKTFQPPGMGSNNGLLGYVSNKYLTNKAEKDVAPIRVALANFYVEKQLQNELLPVLKKSWLKTIKINIIENDLNNAVPKLVEKSNSSTVVIITPVYLLINNLTTLAMVLKLDLYPVSAKLPHPTKMGDKQDKTTKPIYSITVQYTKPLENRNFFPTLNAKQWSENKGEKIKQALSEGITHLVKEVELLTQN